MGRKPYSNRKTVEECQSISTVFLNQRRLFNGGFNNTTLTWSIGGNQTGSMGMFVSMFKGEEHCRFNYTITDRFSGNKTDLDYKVRLVSTPCYYGGQRWWFICPLTRNGEVCNRRVGIIYLAGGEYFGCRHCYDLT
ncbi:MAG: hypothetical protein ACYSTS_11320 [Planctomycetota bacterium]|jgi:hypothetical protein